MPLAVKHRQPKSTLFLEAVAIVIVIAILFALYYTNHLPLLHRAKTFTPAVSGSSETKGEPSATAPSTQLSNNQPSSSRPGQNKGGNAHAPTNLIVPTGTFVSNHRPNLNNNPAGSDYLNSSCTTTPGATCQISFTMGSVTKFLPAETTDASGSSYWNNWRPQDYGITAGTWTIQAIASLNSATKTANDALNLEVSP